MSEARGGPYSVSRQALSPSTAAETDPQRMAIPLDVLIVEDAADDAELQLLQLRTAGIECTARIVDSEEALRRELAAASPAVVLSDFSMPGFSGLRALAILREARPGVPLIFVSGAIGEERAIEALKEGATDYVLKDNLRRLAPAVLRAVEQTREHAARRAAEDALRLSERAVESSTSAVVITDATAPDQPIIYVNPAFERISGYLREQAIGRNCRFLQGQDRDQPDIEKMRSALKEGREVQAVLRNYRKDGSLYWSELKLAPVRDGSGKVTHYVGILNDITEFRSYQEQLEHQATHDALTGLANRTMLADRIEQALEYAGRYGKAVAVALLDLDHFKLINDTYGHTLGDDVIRVIGGRLFACTRGGDTLARLGGDEFVLVLSDLASGELATSLMRRVVEAVGEPFNLQGHDLALTCSVGVSLFPQDGEDPETLIRKADTALYQAKDLGRNNWQFFTPELNARLTERLALEADLRQALAREELFLVYQPQVSMHSWKISAAEALLRWKHPQHGLISPARFIGVAEESGLIVTIGEWVLMSACRAIHQLQTQTGHRLRVSVNISARQFRHHDLAGVVARAITETGIAPEQLELELTEGLIMHNAEEVIETIRKLKRLGVTLAIDDFGTGYSSLSYLKRFAVDRLKLDRSFVSNIATDAEDRAIAQAIVTLGHSLGLKVVAEGVETLEQLELLREYHCDEIQGYLFSRPVPLSELPPLLDPVDANGEPPG